MSILCVIPTHRRAQLLADALDSVLAQTVAPTRIVVSDDADDAATREVVAAAVGRTDIPIEYRPHHGGAGTAGSSRNAGASGADEDFVAFLDDDDRWEPTFLERTSEGLDRSRAGFIVTWSDHVVGEHRSAGTRMKQGLSLRQSCLPNPGLTGSNTLYRREIFEKAGGFDSSLTVLNDLDLLVRLSGMNIPYEVIEQPLVLQIGHPGEHLTTRGERRAQGLLAYGRKHQERMSPAQRHELRRIVHAARRGSDRGLVARGWHLAGQIWSTSPTRFVAGARNRLARKPDMYNAGAGATGNAVVNATYGSAKRVLYLNVHDSDYPRNARIREFLARSDHEIRVVDKFHSTSYLRVLLETFVSGWRYGRDADVIVLSELSIKHSVAAWAAARLRRVTFVVDAFVGWHETTIEDWGKYHRASLRARGYLAVDHFAVRHSDITLTDTVVRARRLSEWGAKDALALPVGAPGWARFEPRKRDADEPIHVLYYGHFIPLHGLDYVLRTVAQLPTDDFKFTFIGDGEGRPSTEEFAQSLGVHARIQWIDGMPADQLRDHLVGADVVLGIFGDSPKARSVLANKVWQGLSVGRYVVTRTSDALAELRPVVGDQQLIEVDPTDAGALKASLVACAQRIESAEYPDFSAKGDRLEQYVLQMYDAFGEALQGTSRS